MNSSWLDAFRGRRVLLLQSPMGPFFRRLAADLRWAGAQVCKINFNGGDWLFFPFGALNFRRDPEQFPAYLARVVEERGIDIVFVFGDCRPIHQAARELAQQRGLGFCVFEEGYLRPDFVTFEREGVNARSPVPRSALFYLNQDIPAPLPHQPVRGQFARTTTWAVLYYLASLLLWPLFPHYRHHRRLTPIELLPWLRGFWRKWLYAATERPVARRLRTELAGRYFLVPLQVHNDAQIQIHSGFDSVEKFVHFVVRSFANHAPEDQHLVIKHHPMDRGYHDYARLLAGLAEQHGLGSRLHYVHDVHLPTLLEHAAGVVVVNSTVGLEALQRGVPLKVCGEAIYDIAGLAYRGSLRDFWQRAQRLEVDRELFRRFRDYLVQHTQLNGSFYARLDVPGSHTGLLSPRRPETGAAAARPRAQPR